MRHPRLVEVGRRLSDASRTTLQRWSNCHPLPPHLPSLSPGSRSITTTAIDLRLMFVASPTNNLSLSTDISTSTTLVPVPAIVGGTSIGVFIAIAAFLGWKWRAFWSGRVNRGNAMQTVSYSQRRVLRKEDRVRTQLFAKESTSLSSMSTDKRRTDKDPTQDILLPIGIPENTHQGARSTRTLEEISFMPRPAQIHSAEEHQIRVPTAVILAALGPNLDAKPWVAVGNMRSAALQSAGEGSELVSSSPGNSCARGMQQLIQQSNRLSHISNGSLNLQTFDRGTMVSPIGLAYGGE
ncbi:hypothetical protein F5I97DRAFT_1827509 [Phlebopus sp. FC_14]|nr:hypothetical protein F5I97DRAFT_1827509 [Phlebopus sp. FC_14]